jgi:hypothetical protein
MTTEPTTTPTTTDDRLAARGESCEESHRQKRG